ARRRPRSRDRASTRRTHATARIRDGPRCNRSQGARAFSVALSYAVPVFLQRTFLYNPLQVWLTGAVTAAIAFVVALLLRRVLVSRLGALAARTTNQIDDMVVELIRETRTWVLLVVALFV